MVDVCILAYRWGDAPEMDRSNSFDLGCLPRTVVTMEVSRAWPESQIYKYCKELDFGVVAFQASSSLEIRTRYHLRSILIGLPLLLTQCRKMLDSEKAV